MVPINISRCQHRMGNFSGSIFCLDVNIYHSGFSFRFGLTPLDFIMIPVIGMILGNSNLRDFWMKMGSLSLLIILTGEGNVN